MTLGFFVPSIGIRAEEPTLDGNWALVILTYGEDEFAVIEIEEDGQAPSAKVLSAQPFLGVLKVKDTRLDATSLTLELENTRDPARFLGTIPTGDEPGPILGSFSFKEGLQPARLERTKRTKVGRLSGGRVLRELSRIQRIEDPKERHEQYLALIQNDPKSPTCFRVYEQLLQNAEAAGLDEVEVRDLIERWQAEAAPYGPAWLNETRVHALRAIEGNRPYAKVAVRLARQALDHMGPGADLQHRADLTGFLAREASLAGETDIARVANGLSDVLEGQLDVRYRNQVPPFRPRRFAGRNSTESDQVVLVELFTGTQCPPCTGAVSAFDSLLATFEPNECLGIQYHLDVPSTDPMTNEASRARAETYGIVATPTIVFNGSIETTWGGNLESSKELYQAYRRVVERGLSGKARATIDLDASRQGDTIAIDVAANVNSTSEDDVLGGPASDSLRLMLVLVEGSLRYVGGSGIRLHHQVVLDMPGGPQGFSFLGGTCHKMLTVDLKPLRERIAARHIQLRQNPTLPMPLPSTDFPKLTVLAFVQNHQDRSIWHAVTSPPLTEPVR